ncbi:MAG: putative addiction module antidote protein CopG/Arc/MetJ family [Devosia sp.]|nr:putative addiction module antidote protein CopG/Arc/MetJ family [Devosia sp.]
MTDLVERKVSLTREQANFIDRMVERGEFKSASELVQDSLEKTIAQESAFESWVEREVIPVADEMLQNPQRRIPIALGFDRIEAKLLRRMKAAE